VLPAGFPTLLLLLSLMLSTTIQMECYLFPTLLVFQWLFEWSIRGEWLLQEFHHAVTFFVELSYRQENETTQFAKRDVLSYCN